MFINRERNEIVHIFTHSEHLDIAFKAVACHQLRCRFADGDVTLESFCYRMLVVDNGDFVARVGVERAIRGKSHVVIRPRLRVDDRDVDIFIRIKDVCTRCRFRNEDEIDAGEFDRMLLQMFMGFNDVAPLLKIFYEERVLRIWCAGADKHQLFSLGRCPLNGAK